jgi:hypothetical protein
VTCHSDPLICEVDSATPQLTKTRSRKPGASRGGEKKLETRSHCLFSNILYINSLRLSVSQLVSDGGFGGWGRERPVKQQATGVSLWRGLDHHGFRVQTVSTKHCSHPKGRNDGRIASLSHRTRGGYKNLPLPPPPTTKRTDGYIEERVFGNFKNFREPRFKMSEPGFWVFSRRVRE